MMMRTVEPIAHFVPEIKDLLEGRRFDVLKEILAEIRAEDLSDSWYRFSEDEKTGIFKLLQPSAALILFESLEVEDQKFLLGSLEPSAITPLLEGVPPSDIAEVFHTLPKKVVRRMVAMVRKKDAVQRIELLMKFETDTAGSLLHPEFIKLMPRMTSRAALSVIHSVGRMHQRKHLWALYVTDEGGRLLGKLTLEDLIAAAPDALLQDVMTSSDHSRLAPEMDQERVASIFAKYDLISAPVVDEGGKLLGVVLVDDIIDVMKEEASEDIAKMAGTRPDEFQEKSVWKIAWFRAPWLLATLFGQFTVFLVVRHFEFVIAEVFAVAAFLPLIPAMGGNIGAQSAMIFVRNIATGRLKGGAKYGVFVREMAIGLILGLLYGCLAGGIAYVFYGPVFGVKFSILVAASVWAAMTTAATVGAVSPLIFEKAGFDPATATGPIVTTVSDILSIIIYFSLATAMLTGK